MPPSSLRNTALLLSALSIVLSACDTTPATDLPTSAATPAASYVTQIQTPLRECLGSACTVVTSVPSGISLPVLARHPHGSDYWLEVEYDGERYFLGPFIQVGITYSSPPGAARNCPRQDCPQRFTIPLDEHVLVLDVVVSNIVQHWTHTVYEGEEIYLGPWIPPPSNPIWENTVIPASETARAQRTHLPDSTPPPSTTTH